MAGDVELLSVDVDELDSGVGYYVDAEVEISALQPGRRSLLISKAVAVFAVIGFASLTVAVTTAIRPAVSQALVVRPSERSPGKVHAVAVERNSRRRCRCFAWPG